MRNKRLSARARKAILTLHVTASVALIGTTASVLLLAVRAAGADRPADAHALYTSIETLAFALAIPFSLTSLITGTVLGMGTQWGVLRHGWVAAKLALQLAIILTGALAVRPWVQHLIDASVSSGGLDEAALGAARWELPLAGAANLLFAATAVGLAVFKPRGPTRLGLRRRQEPTLDPGVWTAEEAR